MEKKRAVPDAEHEAPEDVAGPGDSPPPARHKAKSREPARGKKRSRRELEEELAGAKEDTSRYLDRLARLQAEFDNYKKRQSREWEEFQRGANERLIKELLPVLDNLERAVQHSSDETESQKVLEGVELVLRQLGEALSRFGLEAVMALGEVFDPHVHEAMARVETDGEPPDGTVVEEYQKGYLLQGKILRPAMVAVAKLVDEAADEEPE